MLSGDSRSAALAWLAEVPWAGPAHRQQHLARRLRKNFDVLFVEPPPPMRPPRLWVHGYPNMRVIQVAPLLNAHPLAPFLHWRTARRLASWLATAQLRATVDSHLRSARTSIVVCSNVFLVDAALALKPDVLAVDICDDPRYYPGEPPWTAELLDRTLLAGDVITTSSRALQSEFEARAHKPVVYLGNGIDGSFLQWVRKPAASTPIVGFLGHVGPWVDLGLLERVSERIPECEIKIIGSIDPRMRGPLQRLAARPNVTVAGAVEHAHVPAELSRFSVGVIPFLRTSYTRAVNPVKLYEYASLDLPVVTTDFSPDLAQFAPEIDIVESAESFIEAVQRRLASSGSPGTRRIAENHTWDQLGSRMVHLLREPGSYISQT